MAPEQDDHRNKRAGTVEVTGSSSNLLATHLTTRQNVQRKPLTVPRGPASNSPVAPRRHDSTSRASPNLIDDVPDALSSRGNGVTLPFRDRGKGILPADTNKSVNEDSEMRDAAVISSDDTIDRSSSKGQGRALGTPEVSRPGASIGVEDRRNRVPQNLIQNTDMGNSGNEYWNEEDRENEDDGGNRPISVYPAETVDPPVQEVHETKDGSLEIRPEYVSERKSGEY